MEILQGLLDNLTALLAAHPLAGEWYMAFVRFLFPALAVLILYRAADSPHAGELGPAEPAKRHVPAPDPLGEHPGPEQDGGHLSELSQHLPAACRPLPGRR